MQFDSPELRELRYLSWSPPAHPLINFLGTPEPKELQHHSYRDIPRPLSPTTSNSHSTHFNRAVGSPLTSEHSSPATSESTSIPRLYRILDRVARDRYYARPRHVMIGSEEGVPIKLIGRLPEKVGYERTMWTIKSASYYELCDITQRLEDARHPTYSLLVEETKQLKTRLFLETGRGNNNSGWDYSSLSNPYNSTEEATARHQKGSFAPPVPSEKELEVLIRDASSQILSASDVLSKVLPWG